MEIIKLLVSACKFKPHDIPGLMKMAGCRHQSKISSYACTPNK